MEAVVESSPPRHRLSGIDLVRLSQGFSCVFWGLPIAILFCVQLLVLEFVVADPYMRSSLAMLYFVLFVSVLVLVCVGSFKLWRVPMIGERWKRRARISMALAVINLYFSPFLYWWRTMPDNAFYTINLFAFIGCLICFLFSLNCLSMELGRFLGDASLFNESRLFLGLNAIVLALPSSGAIVLATLRAWSAEEPSSLGTEFMELFRLNYPWRVTLFVVLFLPVSLTLANLWRVKEILVDEIKRLPGA